MHYLGKNALFRLKIRARNIFSFLILHTLAFTNNKSYKIELTTVHTILLRIFSENEVQSMYYNFVESQKTMGPLMRHTMRKNLPKTLDQLIFY